MTSINIRMSAPSEGAIDAAKRAVSAPKSLTTDEITLIAEALIATNESIETLLTNPEKLIDLEL